MQTSKPFALFRILKLMPLRAAAVGAALAATLTSSHAALVLISAIPTAWRLQTYVGAGNPGNVVVWFTGSACSNGLIQMNAPSEQDKNRFWATVMAAKLANRHMFVYYDDATCFMNSFGMDDV